MELQLPTVLRFQLRIFRVFGYFPFSFDKQSQSLRLERLLQLWSILWLSLYSGIACVSLSTDDEFLFIGDIFGHFNDILKIITAQVTMCIIYMETLQQHAAQRNFWLLYHRVNASTASLSLWSQIRQHQRFCICFYGLLLGETVSLVMFILYHRPMLRHLVLFWSVFEPYVIGVRVRLFQCLLHVELLRQEVNSLTSDLRLLIDYTNYGCQRGVMPFRRYDEYLRKVMHKQQLRYSQIYDMYRLMQQAYGRSMIAVLVMIYVRVVMDTYFSYYSIYRGWCLMENLMLVTSLFEIPVFLLSSKSCMSATEELTYQLHSIKTLLPRDAIHSGFSRQLQNFSLQILHQRLRIDGIGIIPLDGYMLTKALGSITMYMLFFVQFMPKFINSPKEGVKRQ